MVAAVENVNQAPNVQEDFSAQLLVNFRVNRLLPLLDFVTMLLISIFILRMVTESDETHKSVAYSDMQKA
jgi:hypothetical protein